MKSIQIKDSYKIWRPSKMYRRIREESLNQYGNICAAVVLNRSYIDMYIEWWLHNIGYNLTKPFCFIPFIKKINLRCKDVDLEEHV